MSHKVNPYAYRLGYNEDWNIYFLPKKRKDWNNWLFVNRSIYSYFFNKFPDLIRLKIEYHNDVFNAYLYLTKIYIDDKGMEIIPQDVKKILHSHDYFKDSSIRTNLIEVKSDYSDAQSVANIIKNQIEQRIPVRTFLRKILDKVSYEYDVKGVKIELKGRLDGSEMSLVKKVTKNKVPLSTLDEDIKFGFRKAITSYGMIGIKVTICKKKESNYRNYRNYRNPRD